MSKKCEHLRTQCLDSRPYREYRRRRYECLDCGERFSTIEVRMDNLRRGGGYQDAMDLLRNDFGMTVRQQEAVGELIQAFLEPEDE